MAHTGKGFPVRQNTNLHGAARSSVEHVRNKIDTRKSGSSVREKDVLGGDVAGCLMFDLSWACQPSVLASFSRIPQRLVWRHGESPSGGLHVGEPGKVPGCVVYGSTS